MINIIEWLESFPKRDAYNTIDERGLVAEKALKVIRDLQGIIALRDKELKAKDLLIEYWYNKAEGINPLEPKININMKNMELDLDFLNLGPLTNPNNKESDE